MKLFKKKKGMIYILLMCFIIATVSSFMYIGFNKADKLVDYNFGTPTVVISTIQSQVVADDFYFNNEVDRIFENTKKNLVDNLGYNEIGDFDLRTNIDSNELIGCKLNGINYWYNEKNVDYNLNIENANNNLNSISNNEEKTEPDNYVEINNEEEVLSEEEILSDLIGEDEVLDEKIEEENVLDDMIGESIIENIVNKKVHNCLPNFGEDFKKNYQEVLNDKTYPDMGVYDRSNRNVEIEINSISDTKYSIKASISQEEIIKKDNEESTSIKYNKSFEKVFDIGNIASVLDKTASVLPELSENIRVKTISCLSTKKPESEELYSKEECIDKIFNDLIKSKDPSLLERYKYIVKLNSDIDSSKEYIGLTVKIIDKNNEKEIQNFGVILRNNIPFDFVKFELEESVSYDKTINVKIKKPDFSEEVSNYLIFYSYDDFMLNTEFLKMLNEKNIQEEFVDKGIQEESGHYYYLKNFKGVNVIKATNDGFSQEDNVKEVQIFQIFNENSYELLKINNLYVMVYAVENKFKFLTDGVDKVKKNIVPKSILGVKPIEAGIVSGSIAGVQNSIKIEVMDYNESDSFIIYLFNNGESKNACVEGQFICDVENCYSSMISATKDNENKYNILLNSDNPNVVLSAFNQIDIPKDNFNLETGQKYDVVVVPVDNQANGIFCGKTINYFESVVDPETKFIYYKTIGSESTKNLMPFTEIGVVVEDKKKPEIGDVEIRNFYVEDSKLYLDWNSKFPNDVKMLKITLNVESEGKVASKFIDVYEDKKLVLDNLIKVDKVSIGDIILVDYSGQNSIKKYTDFNYISYIK